LRGLSEEQLTQLLTKYESYLIQIKQIKERFVQQLESAEKEIGASREKAVKGELAGFPFVVGA